MRDHHLGATVDGTVRIVDAAYLFPARHAGLAQDAAVLLRRMAPCHETMGTPSSAHTFTWASFLKQVIQLTLNGDGVVAFTAGRTRAAVVAM